ncbi:hypothetical protein B0H10DRAFT_1941653 [Mycena sp. CBHHK59/15]|nr:hypothetical protein B0H10DRAFT_1941653 [Mycena sp. CBHHK59/15]
MVDNPISWVAICQWLSHLKPSCTPRLLPADVGRIIFLALVSLRRPACSVYFVIGGSDEEREASEQVTPGKRQVQRAVNVNAAPTGGEAKLAATSSLQWPCWVKVQRLTEHIRSPTAAQCSLHHGSAHGSRTSRASRRNWEQRCILRFCVSHNLAPGKESVSAHTGSLSVRLARVKGRRRRAGGEEPPSAPHPRRSQLPTRGGTRSALTRRPGYACAAH